MKFATFKCSTADPATYGIVVEERLLDLPKAHRAHGGKLDDPLPGTLQDYIRSFGTNTEPAQELADWATSSGSLRDLSFDVDAVVVDAPISTADKFICVGKNNRKHLQELKQSQLIKEFPSEPTGFLKLRSCLVGQDARVARPDDIVEFDYEPEMAFVIARPGYRIAQDDAMQHVFGITLLNDLTAREIQRREVASGTRFWTAKNMPGFGPVGPYVVTLDEIGDPNDLWLTCHVNGEQRMRVNTSEQIYKIADIIKHFSHHIPLAAGDMFSSGSSSGVAVGMAEADTLFLKPGDTVEIAIEGVMSLRTHIVDHNGR